MAQKPDSNSQSYYSKSAFNPKTKRDFTRKGDFYFHWGYNASWYAKSDLNFDGPGYAFTLKQVVAHDRPTKFGKKYFDPSQLTIPQFNFHFGYFIKDNYSISIGWDHMKYVMDIPQVVKVEGYINSSISDPAISTGAYAANYNKQPTTINADMLKFEHTDGFNYASTEIERHDDIWVSASKKRYVTLETGIGAGVLLPRTDVLLFGVGKNNYWNLAGYGFSAKAGIKFYMLKKLYLQNSTKVGWTDLTQIHTTGRNSVDKASQKISYLENYTVLGFQF
ncbi:MAG: hypothetical protein H7Y07_08630 [Pyrinomonadaceae bacterium]|nr:hypothetical protein [Sphingobacteriaceae bacterium]